MKIVQINTADRGGGAEGSAWNLFERYRELGHSSQLIVGRKYSNDPDVLEIPRTGSPFGAPFRWMASAARSAENRLPGMRCLARCLDRLASPKRLRDWLNGRDEFDFPGCAQIASLMTSSPDIIHCHNLHGWYFDLRQLVTLSTIAPVILNLRDTWAVTGHCAYFTDCDRWKTGCGNCPRLHVYPACRRDATAFNWKRKQELFTAARLHVTAPSKWLLDIAKSSMIHGIDYKVIPNGIRTDIFTPGDPVAARKELNLPLQSPIVLFAAAARNSYFKDPETLWNAARRLQEWDPQLTIVVVGMELPPRMRSDHTFGIPYINNAYRMALFYRSADVFMHTAKAEAFGKTVTEAMACGTPVVATATGGLAEQVLHGATGFLVPQNDAEAMAEQVKAFLSLPHEQRLAMKHQAALHGQTFSLAQQANAFLNWYDEILQSSRPNATARS